MRNNSNKRKTIDKSSAQEDSEDLMAGMEREDEHKDGKGNAGKKRRSTTGPTGPAGAFSADQLNDLRESESLFHSSLFRLQLNEMLSEVKLNEKQLNRLNEWIEKLIHLLLSLKSGKCYEITDQLWCKSVKVPLIQEPFAVNGKFCFSAPKVCRLYGSVGLGTAIGPQTFVDIAVEMPSLLWQRHDELNHKYHRKRALYLSHICQSIKSDQLIAETKFTYFNGNHMKPMLLLTPNGKLGKHFRIALTAYPEADQKVFLNKSFRPEKNNIRSNWLESRSEGEGNGQPDEGEQCLKLSSPTYNSCIQHDLHLISNYDYLSFKVKDNQPLKESLILLKIWLKQRGLTSEFSFIVALIVDHLVDIHKLNSNSSSLQIFRQTLVYISNSKWDSEGLSLNGEDRQLLDYYLSYFPVVLLDRSGSHNLCWDITIDSYDRLRHESRLTIDCLDSNQKNSFELTFMTPIGFESKFDLILKLSVASLRESCKVSEIGNDIRDNCGDVVNAFVGHLVPLCKRISGQRVSLVQHKHRSHQINEWSVNELPPHPNDTNFLTIGFLIDEQFAYNTIERGPEADTPEAKHFKEFWGQRSDMRRFQDNSICEAVYWDLKNFAQKRRIVSYSLEYILTNILGISRQSMFTSTALLDLALELPNLKSNENMGEYGTGEEIAVSISQHLDGLAKKLRTLDGLPLTITNVQAIDSTFRSTEVFPPLPMNSGFSTDIVHNCNIFDISVDRRVAKYFKPLEVIIQLEGSGKWPNHWHAFQRVKSSFYIEMSTKLSEQFGLICYSNGNYVDVFESGFLFRLIIGSHKELLLLRQIRTSDGLIKQIESPLADTLETKFDVMPKINSALNGLSRRHLTYGISCRLAKRWISSQMLSFYLNEMAIDLMMAYLYLRPNPYTVPNSPVVAFLRFLSLICDYNWKISPLIVNLNEDQNEEIVTEISKLFAKERAKYPPMFVTSSYDKHVSQWTQCWPDSVILNRLQVIAKLSKQTLIRQMENPLKIDAKLIFRPDLDVFDITIGLKSDVITNQLQGIDFPEKYQLILKEFDPELNQRMPIIGFDPIQQFIRHLRTIYSEIALFFYDQFGGREIGVLLKPSVFESKAFQFSAINGSLLSTACDQNGKQMLFTNIEAIVEDFYIIGDGLVTTIDVRTHKWNK